MTSPACAASSLFLFFWFAALCSCNGHANGYIAAAGATNAGLGLDAWDRCPQHVVVDRAARLVFVDNVKAGSTTVRAFFRARNSTWDCGDLGGGDQLTGHTHTRLKHPADQADQADHGPHHRSQIDGNGDAGPRSRPRPRHGAASNMLSGAADFADNRAHDSGPSGYDGCGFVWKLAGDRPGFGCRTTAGCFEQRDGWIWFGITRHPVSKFESGCFQATHRHPEFRVGGADALLDRVMAGAAPHSETQTVAPPPKRSEAGLRGWANEHLQSTACRLRFRPKPPSDEKHGADAASRPGAVGALAWGQLNLTIRLENATAELMEASRRFGNPTLAALGRWLATTRANSANLVASAERFKRNFSCTLSPPAQARMAGAPPYDQDFLQYGYRLEPGSKA